MPDSFCWAGVFGLFRRICLSQTIWTSSGFPVSLHLMQTFSSCLLHVLTDDLGNQNLRRPNRVYYVKWVSKRAKNKLQFHFNVKTAILKPWLSLLEANCRIDQTHQRDQLLNIVLVLPLLAEQPDSSKHWPHETTLKMLVVVPLRWRWSLHGLDLFFSTP